jgi:hypothetical protein
MKLHDDDDHDYNDDNDDDDNDDNDDNAVIPSHRTLLLMQFLELAGSTE